MRAIKLRLLWLGVLLLPIGCTWRSFFHLPEHGPAPGPTATGPTAPGPGWLPPPPAPLNGSQGVTNASATNINEQISLISQRIRDNEDDKRVLATRVRQLENQLRDKDKALQLAATEIQEAAEQITRTREELQRWKQEMENVRAKLRSVERDNKVTLEAIIRTLEQFLDREKEPAKTIGVRGGEAH